MDIILKAKNVRNQIALVKTRAKKLDDQVHTIAVSCLYHADKHGDVTLMQELIESMGRSQRRNAVIAWASAYGKFQPNEKGKNVDYCRANATDLEGAKGESPWDFKPEQAFRPFDMEAELKKLMKRAAKAADDDRNNVPKDMVAKLSDIMGRDVEVQELLEAVEQADMPSDTPEADEVKDDEAA